MYTFIITFRSSVFFLSIFLSLPHVCNLKVTLHFTSLLHRISTHSYLLSLIIIKCFFFSVSSLDIKLYFLFQEIVCPAFIFIPMNNKQDQRVDVSPSQQLCVFYIRNISSNTRCSQCCNVLKQSIFLKNHTELIYLSILHLHLQKHFEM